MAESNEPPRTAARREIAEELGIDLEPGALLVLDWVGPHGPWDDQLVFVFDGGILTGAELAALRIVDGEISEFAMLAPQEAHRRLRPDMAQRLQRALRALRTHTADYGEHPAQPATAPKHTPETL